MGPNRVRRIRAYLHNETVLATVPPEQLMVVLTHEIRKQAGEIASFIGLAERFVRLDHTHSFQNRSKENILAHLDPGFVEEKVEEYCQPLMARFFPEIKTLNDAHL